MVSFQCEGCGDVVKKPKLDRHGQQCHSSFTCIDCSKTFQGPAQWKSHTSCISEAEKYQGNLYKGPKGQQNGGPRNYGYTKNIGRNGNGPTGKYQQWGRNGGSQGTRPAWGKPYNRYEATGANDTPLGTPVRMSPATTPPASDVESKNETSAILPKTVSAVPAVTTPVATNGEAEKEDKKSKKDKKRKASQDEPSVNSQSHEEPRKKKAKTTDEPSSSQNAEDALPCKLDKKHKKSKKDKKESASEDIVQPDTKESAEVVEEAKKRDKKDKKKKTKEVAANADVIVAQDEPQDAAVETAEPKKKKKSKNAKNVEVDATEADVATVQATEVKEKGKKEKKEKKEKKHKKSKSEVEVS